MLLALFADIHANLPALAACLDAARTLGAERHVFLGDLVGYGPDPAEVVDLVGEMVAGGAVAVLGNHDEAASGQPGAMNDTAARAIAWTRERLGPAHRQFLGSLPLTLEEQDRLFVHADASAPARWHYVVDDAAAAASLRATSAGVTFCGHVHRPAVYCARPMGKIIRHIPTPAVEIPLLPHRKWLAVLGAVGQPRDGNPAACFATFDLETRALVYHRVPYDVAGVASRIIASGLPERLAERLHAGI